MKGWTVGDKDHTTEGKWHLTCCQSCTRSTQVTAAEREQDRLCRANMDTARTIVTTKVAIALGGGGCSGGQLLHCRGSESGGAVSWCHWVSTTGLPPPPRRRRWWRADASGTGSPARQPLKRDEREKRKVSFSLGSVWEWKVLNRDSLIPVRKKKKKPKAWNYLQSSAVAKQQWKQLHRGWVYVCVCVCQWGCTLNCIAI